ncbi:MAG: arginine--tRNA ligase [Candidatus Omnitrophica bacterium]|nr:arginine--tRNA ligase [Candidatus Omnitrophota bacterium]
MLHYLIERRLQETVTAVCPSADTSQILVRPCVNSQFGDYQSNALMGLAKQKKMNPRRLAESVKERLDVGDYCEAVEIAGAGFLNFRLKNSAVVEVLKGACRGEHLFLQKSGKPRTIVIDFSSPNVAKPMHVGHIRSTILGDCLARTFRFMGHRVITDNHLGDWGTQFGKLLVGWRRHLDPAALAADPIGEMERLYRLVNEACDSEAEVLESARQELVKLQKGDPDNLAIWQKMIALSREQFDAIYGRLGVQFDFCLGESYYNPRLKSVVDQLVEAGMARESEGAMVVFFEDISELKAHPAIILKSDGAANYTTTDLATLLYRVETWRPDEIIYVTDARQQLHFKQVFTIFRRWQPQARPRLAHVWFGTILGEDGKPFKTRSGAIIKLADLLDEAEERAYQVVTAKNPELDEERRREIARIVGIGAIKYADLLPNRQSDYVFSWDKMLALNGNTAPYLLYAYTRIRSIFRRLSESSEAVYQLAEAADRPWSLTVVEEVVLAKHLLNLGLVLEAVSEEYRPNYLCNYLYELAGHFARFYETCPVLKAGGDERFQRLALCDLTSQVLQMGLGILGIETTDQM